MSTIKNLAGQTLIYGLGTIIPRVLNYLLLTPFYTRIFLQEEYGVVVELYAYAAFLIVLLTYGMETTFFRFSDENKDNNKVFSTAITSLLTTSILFVIICTVFNKPIADLINYSSNSEYIIYFAIIIGADAFTAIPFAKLRLENKALKFSIIKISNILVNIGLNVFFFIICPKYSDNSIISLIYNKEIGVGYAFISNLVASLFTIILILPEIIKQKLGIDKVIFKKMLNYALPLLIVGLAGMVNEVSDKVFLKYLIPDKENAMKYVGIYGANYKLAVLMTLFIQMFRYAAEPFFFSKAKEKNSKVLYAEVMKLFIVFCLMIFLGVTLYIDVFKYFIGGNFHEGLFVVPIILLANLLLGIYYNLSIWYKLTNKTIYGAYISITGAIITIALNVVLIPKIGYLGSAWATLICYFSMVVISFIIGRKIYYVPYNIKSILLYFLLAFIIYIFGTKVKFDINYFNYIFSTVLIVIFLLVFYLKEYKNLKKL